MLMMANKYKVDFTDDLKNDIKKVLKNNELIDRLNNKVNEIAKNPFHYKTLKNRLKNKRRTHIGSFVLIFEVDKNNNIVIFHSFKHHDIAYK
ncbi:MAG: type II toxin-antitoxin system RelE family toxin [Candidatus Anammoxibacter sp.]